MCTCLSFTARPSGPTVKLGVLLTSALNDGERSNSRQGRLSPRNYPTLPVRLDAWWDTKPVCSWGQKKHLLLPRTEFWLSSAHRTNYMLPSRVRDMTLSNSVHFGSAKFKNYTWTKDGNFPSVSAFMEHPCSFSMTWEHFKATSSPLLSSIRDLFWKQIFYFVNNWSHKLPLFKDSLLSKNILSN